MLKRDELCFLSFLTRGVAGVTLILVRGVGGGCCSVLPLLLLLLLLLTAAELLDDDVADALFADVDDLFVVFDLCFACFGAKKRM